jgi:hypothetical protein
MKLFLILFLVVLTVVIEKNKKKKIQEKYDSINEELWGNKEGYRRK